MWAHGGMVWGQPGASQIQGLAVSFNAGSPWAVVGDARKSSENHQVSVALGTCHASAVRDGLT